MSLSAPTITNAGLTVAATSTSTAYAMPKKTSSLADNAMIVRVVCDQNACFVKFGQTGVVATSNDIMITPQASLITVSGADHFAVLENGSQACNVNLTPVAW